ncbi:hypothetical protein [Accumulibacter sp.]|uniref:hypothetical protein n=1 Tax=Accumulibacter sp. TaxID=2053492 RepID=UPI0025DC9784|nr:hypothetical protein [Accumulibacter sp.]MCM8626285.1 hypothetical protein [Accumulibacter sp.]
MAGDAAGKVVYGTQAGLDAGCPSPLVVNVRDGSVLESRLDAQGFHLMRMAS